MLITAPIRHVEHDLDRRWMLDDYFDLIVWYADGGQLHGFQLCYDKPHHERALTWIRDHGFTHTAVDSGEGNPTSNRTPVLTADGSFPSDEVRAEFLDRSAALPPEIRELVLMKVAEYASSRDGGGQHAGRIS